MMDEVIIWGAGNWGKAAYYFFVKNCNIICFVDNNAEKWGTFLNDKEIVSPEVLMGFKGKVVIAVKNDLDQIETKLEKQYNIHHFLEFGVEQRGKFLDRNQRFKNSCIVMEYMGGLGNQLFQYSLAKYLECKGRDVVADITHYTHINTRKFEINKLFGDNCFEYASDQTSRYYLLKNELSEIEHSGERYVYIEPDITKLTKYSVSKEWENIKKGIVRGYFQTYIFADKVRDTLLKGLKFPEIKDQNMRLLASEIENHNSVSIHVRRGDYLAERERRLDGICSMSYYTKAIDKIKEKVENSTFYIFSDDISWCKENIKIDGGFYIDSGMFANYEDWQDMYLMSICKHNIIANSSFSWWGAWLNKNENKIVIAPQRWDNFCDLENICPYDWIRI